MDVLIHRGYYISLGFEGKHLNLMGSRGCPNKCFFCFKAMFGSKVEFRSIENIVDEIEQECERYDIPNFELSDYDFNIGTKRVYAFCHELKRRGLNLNWFCKMRVSNVTKEMLRTCRDAGMKRVAFGVESADPRVLAFMRKNIDLDQVKRVFEWTRDLGILGMAYFMIGNPGDTVESVERTLRFADELACDLPNFATVVPVPGSDLYDMAKEKGWIRSEKWDDYTQHNKRKPVMRNEALDHEQLHALAQRCKEHVRPRVEATFQKYHGHDPTYVKQL